MERPLTWEEAKKACEALGGYLVCLNSSGENKFVHELLVNRHGWAGGYQNEPEGDWMWLDGNPMSYERWANGEPSRGVSGGEPYIEMRRDGYWNDGSAKARYFYVCEWDRRPDGAPESVK